MGYGIVHGLSVLREVNHHPSPFWPRSRWVVWLVCMALWTTGCTTGSAALGPSAPTRPVSRAPPVSISTRPQRGGLPVQTVALHPAEVTVQTLTGVQKADAFDQLLSSAGLDPRASWPAYEATLSPVEATRLLGSLVQKPVSLAAFPSRMAVGYLLREVIHQGGISREDLSLRVEDLNSVVVLRPDGRLAWVRTGHTQQRVGPLEWKQDAFGAGPFELGRFYVASGSVFRHADARLRPVMRGTPLAEIYDDADVVDLSLEGAQDAFLEFFQAVDQLLVHPLDSLDSLQHLPSRLAALISSSPEYFERLRYMTRGEQIKALSKLSTQVLLTCGTLGGGTRMLTRTLASAELSIPTLSLSAEGVLGIDHVLIPVGEVAPVLGAAPGTALILQQATAPGRPPALAARPGQWAPANESMSPRARAYQEQITGHSADEAYWVGGTSKQAGGVKFDGFKNGVLLDAKGPGYANKFLDNLEPEEWFKNTGAKELVNQAERQLRVAKRTGTPIRWHVAEQRTANAIIQLLRDNEITGIEVLYTPPT